MDDAPEFNEPLRSPMSHSDLAAAFRARQTLAADFAAAQERIAELEAAANMLANTVALLNSMVRSGEYHSPTSEKVMRESLDAYSAALAGALELLAGCWSESQ